MEDLKEILVGRLAVSTADERLNFLAEQINRNINPPRRATRDNVNVRVMYLLNDLVNTHGGRFRRADLINLCRLIVDTPVLIGHDRTKAPLARNFHAELEQKDGVLWLKSYFYWPKAAESETDRLLDMIDSGVLKECSISFIYTFPECSECGQDIRTCPHEIGRPTGRSEIDLRQENNGIHFLYKGITQVLETSVVYKGSVKGTYITDHLQHSPRQEILVRIGSRKVIVPMNDNIVSASLAAVLPLETSGRHDLEIMSRTKEMAVSLAVKNGRNFLLVKKAESVLET